MAPSEEKERGAPKNSDAEEARGFRRKQRLALEGSRYVLARLTRSPSSYASSFLPAPETTAERATRYVEAR